MFGGDRLIVALAILHGRGLFVTLCSVVGRDDGVGEEW